MELSRLDGLKYKIMELSRVDKIIIEPKDANYKCKLKGLYITIKNSKNVKIIIEYPRVFINNYLFIEYSDNAVVHIKQSSEHKLIQNCLISLTHGQNQFFTVGSDTTLMGGKFIIGFDNVGVSIGDNCMFSDDIQLQTCDGHVIYDKDTHIPVNDSSEGIFVDNHVWIANGVRILKDSKIPENCVVGAGALVAGKFEKSNSVIAGIPAKVIKNNINWDRCNPKQWRINHSESDSASIATNCVRFKALRRILSCFIPSKMLRKKIRGEN